MSKTSRLMLLAGIVAFPVGGAMADATSTQQNNPDEIRSIVAEMLADAETRSSLLQSGGTAGHDGHFFIASGDGNFRLNVSGQVQFRYVIDSRDDGNSSDRDGDDDVDEDDDLLNTENDFESGFQTRRTKLIFDGNVINESMFYKVQGAFDYDGGDFELEDAYVGYEFDNGWSMRWGQFKLPFLREELVSSAHQLTVDRSMVNEVFNQGRSQGIELSYESDGMFRGAVAFSDGFRSANSDFDSQQALAPGLLPIGGGESQWAFTGRGELLFAGQWSQFRDFTSGHEDEFGIMMGFAANIQGGDEDHNAYGGDDDYMYASYTVDVSVEGSGWNAFAAFVGSHSEVDGIPDPANPGDTFDAENDDYGLVFQGGLLIPNTDWEIFARYDVIFPDDDARSNDNDFNAITLGTNYYMSGHAAKFSADFIWYLDEQNDLTATNTGIGYLGDDDEDEITIRLQFQLLF